ncbi:hypothetical protein F4810DRAFT_403665 [Camillea tinctor]|nr:hypothetical protein F4810DRAFT_403665 [Camillea tinctor]
MLFFSRGTAVRLGSLRRCRILRKLSWGELVETRQLNIHPPLEIWKLAVCFACSTSPVTVRHLLSAARDHCELIISSDRLAGRVELHLHIYVCKARPDEWVVSGMLFEDAGVRSGMAVPRPGNGWVFAMPVVSVPTRWGAIYVSLKTMYVPYVKEQLVTAHTHTHES